MTKEMIPQNLLRRYPLSMTLVAVIWILCLMPVFPETPLDGISMIDKWTHLVMYGSFVSVIWWEYLRQHHTINASRLFLLAFVAPVVMSGVIELEQAYCTGGRRSGEWLDFAANTLGVCLGTLIGILLAAIHARGRKDS